MSWTYADVDRSEDPAGAARWMDTMAAWPAVAACKRRTVELLDGRAPVLDLGCGVGEEVRALGAIGMDTSSTMLREARARGGSFVSGDAHQLPIATSSLAGVRTERVLQHVSDPGTALLELTRVLVPGGRAVLAEPDQSTLRIDGTDPRLTADIVRFRAASVRNGELAGALAERLARLGFGEVERQSFVIEVSDPELAFGLPTWPAMLVERGTWSRREADAFLASIDPRAFSYRVDCVVTWGNR